MYESLKTGILTEKELPNIKEAYARFKRLPFTHSDPDTSALASFGGRGQTQATECGQSHGRGRGGGHFYYTHCGRTKHPPEKCWDKFGKPE